MKFCNLSKQQKESLTDYALGLLTAQEVKAIESHIAKGCTSCQQEVTELQEVLANLAYGLPKQQPADKVRRQLLARAATEVRPNRPLKFVVPKRPWYSMPLHLGSRVAAALIVLMLLAETVYLIQFNRRALLLDGQIAQLKEQINKKQDIISTMSKSRRLIILDGKVIKASGQAFWDTNHNSWLFYIQKLPPAPKGKVYQLWFITDKNEAISGGLFQTDVNGSVQLPLKTPRDCATIRETAISLEPEGGSEKPRGAIYLSGPV